MDVFKKVLATVGEILLVVGFVGAVIFFLFPDMFGRGKEEEEVASFTEPMTHVTTETVTEVTTEETEEETTEEITEAATELTTEEKTKAEEKARTDSNLKDEKAPFFMIFNSSPTAPLGEVFDIHKYVGYADDVDRNVDIKVDGNIDIFEEGTYPVKITLTDDAGHTTSKDMEVEIARKEPSDNSGGGGGSVPAGGEDFSKFIEVYKTDMFMQEMFCWKKEVYERARYQET